jgi:hypothetical protein
LTKIAVVQFSTSLACGFCCCCCCCRRQARKQGGSWGGLALLLRLLLPCRLHVTAADIVVICG